MNNLPIDVTYTITEIDAPDEFVKSEPVDVRISYAGQNVQVSEATQDIHNKRKLSEVSISKQFEYYSGKKYAKIGLYTAEELYGLPADSLLGYVEFDGDGKKTIRNIPIDGNFYFKEMSVNEAYQINENKFPVSTEFGMNNNATFVADAGTMINKIIPTTVSLFKTERGSDKKIPVPGATYELIRLSDNRSMGRYTTDQEGKISVTDLSPDKYKWKEITAPMGYFLNEEEFTVETKPGETTPVHIDTDNEKIPTIGTIASFDNKGKLDNPTNSLTIYDEVSYTDLVPGEKYQMNGALMHQETGEALLDDNGNEIKATVDFTPNERNGSVMMKFTVSREAVQRMRGQHITVFEWLVRDTDFELTNHTDIDDADQTVEVTDPKIETDAAYYNGEKL